MDKERRNTWQAPTNLLKSHYLRYFLIALLLIRVGASAFSHPSQTAKTSNVDCPQTYTCETIRGIVESKTNPTDTTFTLSIKPYDNTKFILVEGICDDIGSPTNSCATFLGKISVGSNASITGFYNAKDKRGFTAMDVRISDPSQTQNTY